MWAQSRTTQISEENNVLKVKLRRYLTSSMHTSIKLIVWQRLSRKNNPGSEHWKKESGEDSNLLAFPLQYVESSLGRTRQRELAEKGTGERQDSRERERYNTLYLSGSAYRDFRRMSCKEQSQPCLESCSWTHHRSTNKKQGIHFSYEMFKLPNITTNVFLGSIKSFIPITSKNLRNSYQKGSLP